jgi:NADH-quinone oxidoreductase subunit L
MPITYGTIVVASMALVGVFPFAGFWSKDEILADAWEDRPWVFFIALTGVYLTALYVGRMLILTFEGEYRGGAAAEGHGDAPGGGHHGEPHESPPLMTYPLLVLAVLAFGAGFLNAPFNEWLGPIIEGWVPEETEELMTHSDFKMWIAATSVGVGLAGLWTAWAIYQAKWLDPVRIRALIEPVPEILENRYYLDALYQDVFVKGIVLGTARWGVAVWDRYVIDGAVNGVAKVTSWSASQLRLVQAGQAQLYGGVMFLGTIAAVVGVLVVNA